MSESAVTIVRRRPVAMWNVRGDPVDAFGIALPSAPNTAAGNDEVRALWLGPDEWLIVASHDLPGDMRMTNGTVTDVSHGRAVVRVSGRSVRDALAQGCALDLDLRAFPLNGCAQTAIAKINIVIDHVAPDVFDLYCPRSYAGSFWHWLTEAAAEYSSHIEL